VLKKVSTLETLGGGCMKKNISSIAGVGTTLYILDPQIIDIDN